MDNFYLNWVIAFSNLCWGIWGIFDKKALEVSSPRSVLLIQYFMALPEFLLLAAYMFFAHKSMTVSPEAFFWAAIGAATSFVAMVAYMVAMSRTEASFVLAITASYPLVMQLFATAFLGETLVGMRMVGAALIGAGVFLVGYSGTAAHEQSEKDKKLILFCVIIATLGWGIHGLFDKKAVALAEPMAIMMSRCVVDFMTFLVMLAVLPRMNPKPNLSNKKVWMLCTLSAVSLVGGYLSYLKAMTVFSASYVIVITGCYPLLMYLFALIFLKEKLNWVRLCGVTLVVGGGALVQLTQG